MALDETRVAEIVERVVRDMLQSGNGSSPAPASPSAAPSAAGPSSGSGIFATPDEAIDAAEAAQRELMRGGLTLRRTIVEAMRAKARERAEVWARAARDETGMGHYPSKVIKNLLVANNTPGPEDLEYRAIKGEKGLHLIDGAPWGVICAITPSTNPTATVINNGITMISAGNAVVFCPHPSAARCTLQTMVELNEAIIAAGGPRNLLTGVAEPTLKTVAQIMKHDKIRIIAATGGPGVVRAASESGKKFFAAGPGNPPVVVDATADLERAARLTVLGSSFDNNLPCVAEKVAIVESRVVDEFVRLMGQHGAQILSPADIQKILPVVLDGEHPRRESIGQDAVELLRRAGIPAQGEPLLLVAKLDENHPMVEHEQMMPFLPVVAVRDFDDAMRLALKVEHGFGHTAVLYSRDTRHIDTFVERIGTTITVINGPSYAWTGDEGEGWATMTVTTPTGEGITSPRTWVRKRHLVYSGMLHT